MKSDSIARSELSSIQTAMFGLAGVSIVFLLHIFGETPLDSPMRIALYCFVISIPLLISLGINLDIAAHRPNPDIPFDAVVTIMPLWLGPWFTVAGVTSCLWHYELGAALTFLTVSVAAAVMFGLFQHRLTKSDSDLEAAGEVLSSTDAEKEGR